MEIPGMGTDLTPRETVNLQSLVYELYRVKEAADGGTPLASNQGQALDGYAELAAYRQKLEAYLKRGKTH